MNSLEILDKIVKAYLKPTLKAHGYKTSGKTWWKDRGEFFVVINLQNSQWNSSEDLSFCLNIGVALTSQLADKNKQKPNYSDLATNLREDAYLPEERRRSHPHYRGWLGYGITNKTDVADFIDWFRVDLEDLILPRLSESGTLTDCIEFYDKFDFWGENLRRQIRESGIDIN
jgi:hypothetical protein